MLGESYNGAKDLQLIDSHYVNK